MIRSERSPGVAGVLLFGGAFNPPHRSHRRVLCHALDRLGVAHALILPTGRHPLKDPGELAADQIRVELCQLAFGDLPGVEVSELDLRLPGPAYSIDTVAAVRDRFPGQTIYWLLGADNLGILDQWHQHHQLLALATMVTFPRRGYPVRRADLEAQDLSPAEIEQLLAQVLDCPADEVSATAIRAAIRAGEPPDSIAPQVLARIHELELYRT